MVANYATQAFTAGLSLAAPNTLAAGANVGGGTFANAAYFWKITGTNSNGETSASNEATVTIATNGTCSLTWAALPAGTTGVRVYRGTVTQTENVLVAVLGAVVAYTDTGTSLGAGAPPAVNSAGTASYFVEAGARRDSVTDATLIALFASNFTATPPAAGAGNVTGVMAGYLAAYPTGP